MFSIFEMISTGHLGRINFAENRNALILADANQTQFASYQVGPKAREFENNKIDQMLTQGGMEAAQTKWVAAILFAQKKNGSSRLCALHQKVEVDTKLHVDPILRMDKYIDSSGEVAVFCAHDA